MNTDFTYTVAFYNLENYFDTRDDHYVLDDDFTPKGFKKWDHKRFEWKTKKLAKAISQIGIEEYESPPVLIGIAEVENSRVIKKLLNAKNLKSFDYGYVHYDSPDERGIDTGLLYHKDYFKPIHSETIPLLVENTNGDRDLTRDILYVQGALHGEEIHLFINHWPSRRDGATKTAYKRIAAAETIISKVEQICHEDASANFIIMGDFNDDPSSESIKMLMQTKLFINPFEKLLSPNSGSANYKGQWSLFDQIIVSHSFLNFEKGTHSFQKASIFAPKFLKEWTGRYKGNPYRTYTGKKYIGGYSDHFPVWISLKYNSK